MKKMNVFITAFTLAITAIAPMVSSAAAYENVDSKDVELSKKYESSYTLILPDESPDLNKESVDVQVGVNAYLQYSEKLTVSVKSKNEWTLKDTNVANSEAIDYTLKVGEKDLTKNEDGTKAVESKVMSVTDLDNNEAVMTTMTFTDFGTPTYAGTYADTLTFAVNVEAISAEERAAAASAKKEKETPPAATDDPVTPPDETVDNGTETPGTETTGTGEDGPDGGDA